MSIESDPLIRVENISKSFGSIQALDNISLQINSGEIFTIAGDNGAGKSTLIKILSGVLKQSNGTIYLNGKTVNFSGYHDAQMKGIETVYQNLAITPHQQVYENIFLGKEPIQNGPLGRLLRFIDEDQMQSESADLLNELNMDLDPTAEVGTLSGGEQQSVAISRTVQSDPNIIIMDEPTSALSVEAAGQVLNLIKRLRDEGLTVILIDHNLEEVLDVSDRVAVLASGRLMGVDVVSSLSKEILVEMMMGVKIENVNSSDTKR